LVTRSGSILCRGHTFPCHHYTKVSHAVSPVLECLTCALSPCGYGARRGCVCMAHHEHFNHHKA
jgi:hypothetical protein